MHSIIRSSKHRIIHSLFAPQRAVLFVCLCGVCMMLSMTVQARAVKSSKRNAPRTSSKSISKRDVPTFVQIHAPTGIKRVPIVSIRGKNYCSFGELISISRIGKLNSKINTLKLAKGDTKQSNTMGWNVSGAVLQVEPTSFFVRVQRPDSIYVIQLSLPPIRRGAAVLVPYPQFFTSVAATGLISFQSPRRIVRWSTKPAIAQEKTMLRVPSLFEPPPRPVSGEGSSSVRSSSDGTSSEQTIDTPESKSNQGNTTNPGSTTNQESSKQPSGIQDSRVIDSPAVDAKESPSVPSRKVEVDTFRQQVPIRQMFPRDLKRRELDDSADSMLRIEYDGQRPIGVSEAGIVSECFDRCGGPMLAAVGKLLLRGVPRITSVVVRHRSEGVVFRFTADEALHQPPRVTVHRRRLRIAFPGVVNAARYPSSFPAARVTRFQSFLDNSHQIYSCLLPKVDMSALVQRRSAKCLEIVCGNTGTMQVDRSLSNVQSAQREQHSHLKKQLEGSDGVEEVKKISSTTSYAERDVKSGDGTKRINASSAGTKAERALEKERKKWRFDCVVIDAGHGGKDDGAHSIHGYREKDATLAIALSLRSELRKRQPGLKVVMTRSKDVFIPLHERGSIANRADGKLFVSIHCNSVPRKPSRARGCETYILSPAKTSAAIDVATRENAVVQLEDEREKYAGMTSDQQVLATLAQTSFVKFSSAFAHSVQKNVVRLTDMPDRGVSQAGFLVLVCASMPAVLVETGFVSHPEDEKLLFRPQGQRKIAQGIATAIGEYASSYAKQIQR